MSNKKRFTAALLFFVSVIIAVNFIAYLYIRSLPDKNHLFSMIVSRIVREPVDIQKVSVTIFAFTPGLQLEGVVIHSAHSPSKVIRIPRLRISIDVWKSLLSRRLKTQVITAGVGLHVGNLKVIAQLSDVFSKSPRIERVFIHGDHVAIEEVLPFFVSYNPALKTYQYMQGYMNFNAWMDPGAREPKRFQAKVSFLDIKNSILSIPSVTTHFVIEYSGDTWEAYGKFADLNLENLSQHRRIAGLSGEFRLTPTRGVLSVFGKKAHVDFDSAVFVGNLFSQFDWVCEKNRWRIENGSFKWGGKKVSLFSSFFATVERHHQFQAVFKSSALVDGVAYDDLKFIVSRQNAATPIRIKANTVLSTQFIKQHFSSPLLKLIHGKTPMTIKASVASLLSPNIKEVTISSKLKGIAVSKLPVPFYKSSQSACPMESTVRFLGNDKVKVYTKIASLFSLALIYDQKKKQIFSGNIHLGSGSAQFQFLPGWLIDGGLPYVDLKQWRQAFRQFVIGADSSLQLPKNIRKLDLNFGYLRVHGVAFKPITVRAISVDDGTRFTLYGPQAIGDIYIPQKKEGLFKLDFKKLNLVLKKHSAPGVNIDPLSLPALNAVIDQLTLNKQLVGKLSLILQPIAGGVSLHELKVQSPLLSLNARGRYVKLGDQAKTVLTGDLQSKNLGQFLSLHHLSSRLKGGDFSLNFAFSWPGSLRHFSIQTVMGQFQFFMQDGRIMQLDSSMQTDIAIGRLLNLMSLETLTQLLKLNFSAITNSGFAFDDFRGKGDLDHGLVYARYIDLQGPVAKVNVTGKISLQNQENDLKMYVVPTVSASLPAIVGIAGGPVAGAATWVANKLFSSSVNSLMEKEYHITGTWDRPKID